MIVLYIHPKKRSFLTSNRRINFSHFLHTCRNHTTVTARARRTRCVHAQLALTDFLDTWISTDRHHPSARRQRPRSLNGRSDTPGAVAAAAHAPQTTNAATLRQQRSLFRRFCCLTGCLISDRRGCRCPRCDHPASVANEAGGDAGAVAVAAPTIDLLPCGRACARASGILARPLSAAEPRRAGLAKRQSAPCPLPQH